MRLTVLGCAGTFPSAESGCSSYLVQHDGFNLLVDAGNGAIGALQRHVGILDVDAVLLSHLHADHCIDLVAYSYARRYHPDSPPRIPVYGPRGTQDRLCQAFETRPRDRLEQVYEFRTTSAGTCLIGPFTVTLTRTAHPIECYAVRLSAGGGSILYSADTGPSDAVAEAAKGVDVFLCEATWLEGGDDNPPDLHMTARQAGQHATRAGAGRLVLVHTTSYLDQQRFLVEAAQTWDGPLELARPGAAYEV